MSKKLFEDSAALFKQAEEILAAESVEQEDFEKAQKMVQAAKDMRAKGLLLQEVQKNSKDLDAELDKMRATPQPVPAPEAPKDFKDWTEFLVATWYAGHRELSIRKVDQRLRYFAGDKEPGLEEKQMVEGVGASGGFLVPAEFLAQLQAVAAETSIVRPRATIIRMRRRQIDIPVLNQTGTAAGQGHWFGGMVAYWGEEAHEKTRSEPTFRKVTLVANKLIMYTRSSDELMDDSAISLSDFLAGPLGFAGAIAWTEDLAFINGTGAGQPSGVITAPATFVQPRAVAGTFGYVDLVNMVEHFLPSAQGLWTFTQQGLSNLMTLTDPNGSYIWQPNAREGVPNTLFGYPVMFTEKQPAVGTQGDVLLADWRYYLIGDRQATTVESTQYDFWRFDQTSWRAVHRVDGQPWLSSVLTYQDGATVVSPFVVLGDVES